MTMNRLICILAFLIVSSASVAQDRMLVRYVPGADPTAAKKVQGEARWLKKLDRIRVHVYRTGNPAAALARFRRSPLVEMAEADERKKVDAVPNDPSLGQEWHVFKVSAPTAWDTTTGAGVIVAILDTGCDPTHPDLASHYVAGTNTFDGGSTADVYGHGTATAGTAGAIYNNTLGVVGIAGSCTIMPCRISGLDGYATFSAAASALTWAADHGALVANISYQMSESSTLQSAAQYFQSKGGVVCVSAGNSGLALTNPDNPYVLTVGSTNSSDARSSFSNYGPIVDIWAPGENILTTNRGGGYGGWSGTSFSAPIVAGVAALALAAHPGISGSQAQDIVKQAVDAVSAGNRVNAAKAVNGVVVPPPPPPDTQAPTVAITAPASGSSVPNHGNLTVTASASDNVAVTRVELYLDGQMYATDTGSPWSFGVQTKKLSAGTHSLLARAYDAAGNVGVSGAISILK